MIQRRGDFGNDEDFFLRNWTEYRNGFGSPNKELWIGLESMFLLSNVEPVQVCTTIGKDWRTKYYYEAMCRTVACILYAMKSYAVASGVAQIFKISNLFSINKRSKI